MGVQGTEPIIMLSIDLIRREPASVRQALEARGEADPLAELLQLDTQWRQASTQGDELRARRNRVSRQLGQARSSGQEPSPEIIQEMRQVGEKIDRLEKETQDLEQRINTILLGLPNLPLPDVPTGEGEEDNVEVRRWGEPRTFDFTPLAHWDLGEQLGIIDFQRGVKLSGSRFYTMFGAGAKLERALISWMLDLHTLEHGYTEVMLPLLVKRESMEGSRQPAQVQREPLPRRRRRPVVDSHRRGTYNQPAPGRDSCSRHLAAQLCGLYTVLSAGESGGGPGHPGH